ncbi:Hypp7953 [Branchiostoma lanceolatum]|uniref:Hypp7953 protein n=1 Tax=Branchiostoma lanceolatum TaxID=7740 RepID=A0A8J9Z5J4_BRALA|nr:Hypp7953 [Branchiostoma lanceolatum]
MPQSLRNSGPFEPEKLQEDEDSPFLERNAAGSTGRTRRFSSGQSARSPAKTSEKTPLLNNNGGNEVGLREITKNSRKSSRRKPKKVWRQLAMKRQSLDAGRRYFNASGEYGGSISVHMPVSEDKDTANYKQSRHIPKWAWFLVAKSLGIKLKEKDRPWFGTFLYLLTLTSGLALGICTAWRTVVDILDIHTSQNAIDGTILVLLTMGWISVGVYANGLAFKLFSNKHFYDSVRVHSKTIFKINAVLLIVFLCTVFGLLTNYNKFYQFLPEHCEKIHLNPWICYVMYGGRVAFSLFCLGWNALVATICLSVCRTHTIAIRKFIKDLEEDGMAIDTVRFLKGGGTSPSRCQANYIWDDTHEDLTLSPPTPTPVLRQENPLHQFAGSVPPYLSSSPLSYGSLDAPVPPSPVRRARNLDERKRLYSTTPQKQQDTDSPYDQDSYENSTSELLPNAGDPPMDTQENPLIEVDIEPTVQVRQPRGADGDPGGDPGSLTRVPSGWREKERSQQQQQLPQILTNGAILHTYWRIQHRLRFTSAALQRWLASWITLTIFWCITYIQNWLKHEPGSNTSLHAYNDYIYDFPTPQHRLRFTSSALQRWLASWITLTIFWCITYILNWLKHEATIPEMFEFLLPLLTLPILCSAVAEVNGEGVRVIKSICPTEDRFALLDYVRNSPLVMTMYGTPVTTSSLAKVAAGIFIALMTNIMLREIDRGMFESIAATLESPVLPTTPSQ